MPRHIKVTEDHEKMRQFASSFEIVYYFLLTPNSAASKEKRVRYSSISYNTSLNNHLGGWLLIRLSSRFENHALIYDNLIGNIPIRIFLVPALIEALQGHQG